MSSQCEVVIFENQSVYGSRLLPAEGIAAAYVKICAEYIHPQFVPESNTALNYGNTFITYRDRSGNDKPFLIVLMGVTVDTALVAAIKLRLKELYVVRCGDCGNLVEDRRWALCLKCRNR